jgi:hypothetical protein
MAFEMLDPADKVATALNSLKAHSIVPVVGRTASWWTN